MKISFNWLKNYISHNIEAEQAAQLLTSSGLEVEEITAFESIAGGLKNVVIGHVLTKEKHPDADKLSITTVDVGSEILQIVCGAPNVDSGQKVVVALVGAELSFKNGDKITIKKSKIRGIESNGMICAEDELGLGESHDGIMILPSETPIGMAAASYFNIVNDVVFDINLTPNRGDAYSHIGVARDLNAVMMQRLAVATSFTKPQLNAPNLAEEKCPIEVSIETDLCTRYTGIYIQNIEVKASPDWLQNALKSIGIKSINNIIDISNYVLHEYGQPTHIFDADKIEQGKIFVKHVAENTPFVTLDNQELKLTNAEIMICDAVKPLCIAGVYGGLNSSITNESKNIFIESACFDATAIRKSATRFNLRTDAAMHFEKGSDPNITVDALKRVMQLVAELAGGKATGSMIDIYPHIVAKKEIAIRYKNINRLIGKKIDPSIIQNILKSLEIDIKENAEEGFIAVVPTFKNEVSREADIIEEILRIYGFDLIEVPKDIYASLSFRNKTEKNKIEAKTANFLQSNGFFEMMTNPITQSKFYKEENTSLVKLLNSMTSELDAMRQNMIYGGLESIAYNLNRKNNKLRFFEFGSTFTVDAEKKYIQNLHLVLYMSGLFQEKTWQDNAIKSSFFHLKSFVVETLELLGITDCQLQEVENEYAQYGVDLHFRNKPIATICNVSAKLSKQFDIKEEVFYADINWDEVLKIIATQKIKYKPISKFPNAKRDLALILDDSVSYETLRLSAKKTLKNQLLSIQLFDLYKGEKISNDKKSLAISFVLGDENKTLADADIEKMMSKLIEVYKRDFNAEIRS